MHVSKIEVVAALRAVLLEELAAVERIAAAARDETTSAETRQEGKYDTRATEASYLARGQAWRVAELRRLAAWFEVQSGDPRDVVGVGALVALAGARQELVFVAPVGGLSATVGGRKVRVISPGSPLGKALTGLEADDGFELQTPRGRVDYEVLAIW